MPQLYNEFDPSFDVAIPWEALNAALKSTVKPWGDDIWQ